MVLIFGKYGSMDNTHTLQGRCLNESDLANIRALVDTNPCWSRTRLAIELAQAWNWRTAAGQIKHFAAYSLLSKLEQRGRITLPVVRSQYRRCSYRAAITNEELSIPAPITEPLSELMPLNLEVMPAGHPDRKLFSRYLVRYHYLGYRGHVGENLGYMVRDRLGRDLACVLFGAAAWRVKPRDEWIGWKDATRADGLSQITNNTRFLILPWVRVPHLASHILAKIVRRLNRDWQIKYGHSIHLVETFVERDRFHGTCYRASNWIYVGQTQGRSRQDRAKTLRVPIKDIYLYPLNSDFREKLCHA